MINCQKTFNIIIYGYGSHGKRIKNLIGEINQKKNFHTNVLGICRSPKKRFDITLYKSLNDLRKDCKNIDAVFITTPNDNHLQALKNCLEHEIPYIYVEKPAFKVEKYCEKHKDFIEGKVNYLQVGYHMNYEDGFKEICKIIRDKSMGNLLKLEIFSGHGIAYKTNFKDSWRAKDPEIIIETVMSHLINIVLKINGGSKLTRDIAILKKNEEIGYYDTCHLGGVLDNGAMYSLTASWGAPLKNIVRAYFSDGFWSYNYDIGEITKQYPRDIFDQRGYFIPPKVTRKKIVMNGLENSISYFLEKMSKNQKEIFEFNESQLTARIVEEFTLID